MCAHGVSFVASSVKERYALETILIASPSLKSSINNSRYSSVKMLESDIVVLKFFLLTPVRAKNLNMDAAIWKITW